MDHQTYNILDKKLTAMCEAAHIPGMALMIAKAGKPIFAKTYGWRNVEEELPVTSNTIFGAASLTKSVTALAIMLLEDMGKLSTDDSIKQWLPEFSLPDSTYGVEHITIHHLLTHTSGLPGLPAVHAARLPSILRDPDGNRLFDEMPSNVTPITSVPELINLIADLDFTMLGAPGEMFNYSNEGYALLQEITERASGESFIQFVDRYIFQPLDMHRSYFTEEDIEDKEDVTELYAYENDHQSFFHSPAWWDVGAIYSNGSLKTCASDLMTYLEVYRQGGTVFNTRIISEKAIKKMTTSHVTTPNGSQYGYGLQVDAMDNQKFVGHGGSIKGVSSNMQWAIDDDLTGIVLINIADADAAGILKTTMKHLIRSDEEAPTETAFSGVGKHKEGAHTIKGTPVMMDKQLARFTGVYRSGEGQNAEVLLRHGALLLRRNGNDTTLYPCDENQFLTSDNNRITFLSDSDGCITGIFIGMRHIQKIK
ncbi:serine hydrolase domain-containing protein [Lentibacillus saliphilus]|uniref:serine hydrolase domain-containing protein n=1 Tax=Lentibacillus saliphilus TaxID=2737028 RepID=UPI001C2F27D7|nr:serine hydrolase domain-containing protein [Lentibacillus saliphilus]